MAAWSWYWPSRVRVSASLTSATPSSMQAWFQRAAILLGQRDQRTVGGGTARPPGLGQQHERQQAGDLAVVGEQPVQLRVSRIASPVSSARVSSDPDAAV